MSNERGDTMSTKEVCAALGISRTALYDWMREGRIAPLPPQYPAKRRQPLRFRRADVERLMRQSPPTP